MRHLWSWLTRWRPNRHNRYPLTSARLGPPSARQRRHNARLVLEPLEERTLLSSAPWLGAGSGLAGQYFSAPNFTAAQVVRVDPTVNFNWGWQTAPTAALPSTHWSARWTGQVQAQFSETYTFTTNSDDGVRLIVNGVTLINDWNDHAPRQDSGTMKLVAGQKYVIEMDYYQGAGGALAQLFWSSPSTAKQIIPTSQLYPVAPAGSGTGLIGQYFTSKNLNGLKATRVDGTVDFNWPSNTAPLGGLPANNWSVRWVGQVQSRYSETYTFYTRSDDGVRLYVNGQKLIDNWTDHAVTENSATIRLVAGQKYTIEMDYYQAAYSATAQLLWSSPSTVKQIIPTSQLYAVNPPSGAAPPSASLGAADVTSAGGVTYTFSVTYAASAGIDVSTLGTGNLIVSGPNGFSQVATLVAVNTSGNGTPRTATYQIAAPTGAWNIGANGTYRVTLQSNQVKDAGGNLVGGGVLGAFQVHAPADWFSQNLSDAALANRARALEDDDGRLSRTDLVALFSEVGQDGAVTAAELAGLRQLVSNAAALAMPDFVRNLANKVVNDDPANQHYQGQLLGDLVAGNTARQLQNLVNKWFLGLDHPTVDASLHYALASGNLFGGTGPTYADIRQGALGDCYFLAGLAEVAYRLPGTIENMFIANGDGTFTVRFLNNGVADYVTVDKYLPEATNGLFKYANQQASLTDPNNVLWVALAEKAYAQLAESGWSRGAGAGNAFSAISWGWEGDVVRQVAGHPPTSSSLTSASATLTAIVGAFNAGKMVTLDSNAHTDPGIVANHVYVVIGYAAGSQTFTCYNPWGYVQQLTWGQVAGNFSYWTVG